jgi:multiple sugar transport system ATP-binding protein
MATRIAVLNKGNLEQVGTPYELYNSPRNLFVASFIGSPKMNLIEATLEDGQATVPGLGALQLADAAGNSGPITIGIRPEHVTLGEADGGLKLNGTITIIEYLGSEVFVYVALPTEQTILVQTPGNASFRKGEPIALTLGPENLHIFDAAGQRISTH